MATRKRSRPDAPRARDPLAWSRVPDVTAAEGFAIKALFAGEASPDQQRRAIAFIERAANLDQPAFLLDHEGGDRGTNFMLGRQFVGFALRAVRDLPIDKLRSGDD